MVVKIDLKWFEEAAQRWIDMNAKFHKTISDSSNSRYLARTILDVTSGYARSVMRSSALSMNSYRIEGNIIQHERILKALEDREPARARRAMVDHVLEVRRIRHSVVCETDVRGLSEVLLCRMVPASTYLGSALGADPS